jgi:hypothetical protein
MPTAKITGTVYGTYVYTGNCHAVIYVLIQKIKAQKYQQSDFPVDEPMDYKKWSILNIKTSKC